jgi:hypothetical protein
MKDEIKPYVGITGFTSKDDVLACLDCVPGASYRKLMVGVLLSYKTIDGGENKYAVRYPHYRDISNIFVNHEKALNFIHYNTKTQIGLSDELLRVAEIGGENCHGFQLNITWPSIDELKKVKQCLPNHKFVIQVSGAALRHFDIFGKDAAPELLRQKVSEYENSSVIDYMLLDPSGGRGISFSKNDALEFFNQHTHATYGLSVAGGLSSETIGSLDDLIKMDNKLSWDAEGGLRDADDNFLIDKAMNYLSSSFMIDRLIGLK